MKINPFQVYHNHSCVRALKHVRYRENTLGLETRAFFDLRSQSNPAHNQVSHLYTIGKSVEGRDLVAIHFSTTPMDHDIRKGSKIKLQRSKIKLKRSKIILLQ